MTTYTSEEDFVPTSDDRSIVLGDTLRDLAVVTLISVPLQLIATDLTVLQVLAGLAALYVVCILGLLLTKYLPFYLPSVAWISLVGIVLTLPFMPWAEWFTGLVVGIDFLAMAVPALAYAGLAISKLELDVMRRSGWKILIVAILVFIGTYVGSAAIADLTLRFTT
ncbi:hypothetical protein [Ornithinimicrobium pratense]|uniref:Uncharacterized protein n=1 Tax=Ornithinimicrobium pratense TaxID=2593973 RepID=A0A5J6V3H1_9MICO|nr:hypothetical protein [Ornithinimicrobium pratense]QFG68490.1 hypothetical protein FY030_06980 [Ornithinimicrobium pratense]